MRQLLVTVSLLLAISANLYASHPKGLRIWFNQPNPEAETVWIGEEKLITAGSGGQNKDRFWEDLSLPIGNGSLGANIIGSIATERITFNEKTLWRGGPNTAKGASYYWNVNKESAAILKDIRQAFMDGDQKKAAQLTQDNFNGVVAYESDGEEPSRFGSFTTAGEFRIKTGIEEKDITDYERSLSLDSAIAKVSFCHQATCYKRNILFPILQTCW